MNNNQKQLVNEYIEYLHLLGHRTGSIESSKRGLNRFFTYLDKEGLELTDINVGNASDYQQWLIEQGALNGEAYQNHTIVTYFYAAKHFYNFLKKKGIIYSNPFLEVRTIRTDRRIPRNLLREKELSILLDELAKFNDESFIIDKIRRYRAHVASELMYATGLRSEEAAKLKVEDIDFNKGTVNVREGKGGAPRLAFLNEYTVSILKIYIRKMRKLIFNRYNQKKNTLFGVGAVRFNQMINQELKKASLKTGLTNTFTSHCFRHCVGYHLLKSGCDIRYIQEILGHKSISSTEIYTKIDKEDLKVVFNKYHPRKFNMREKDENINRG